MAIDRRLLEAAKREEWGYVDSRIEEDAKNPEYVKWAYQNGLQDKDGNVRDLAVSILERAECFPRTNSGSIIERLYELMTTDDNRYVRFRSAFALANHDPGEHRDDVLRTLREAEKDKDVSGIAKGYLAKFN